MSTSRKYFLNEDDEYEEEYKVIPEPQPQPQPNNLNTSTTNTDKHSNNLYYLIGAVIFIIFIILTITLSS